MPTARPSDAIRANPPHDLHRRQGGYECIDAEARDHHAIGHTHGSAAGKRRQKPEHDRARGVRGHDRNHSREGDGGADGKVEVSRREAEHHGAGDETDGHHGLQQAEHVAFGEEIRNRQRYHQECGGENNHQALLAEKEFFQGRRHR